MQSARRRQGSCLNPRYALYACLAFFCLGLGVQLSVLVRAIGSSEPHELTVNQAPGAGSEGSQHGSGLESQQPTQSLPRGEQRPRPTQPQGDDPWSNDAPGAWSGGGTAPAPPSPPASAPPSPPAQQQQPPVVQRSSGQYPISDASALPLLALSKVPFPQGRAGDMAKVQHGGSLSAFVAAGGRLPVMVVTYNRAQMLQRTLDGLLAARGLQKDDIFVVQDGGDARVKRVLESGGWRHHQKTGATAMRGGRPMDGGARISSHYGYALRYMFEQAAPWAPGIIVAEDDFLFAVDYYEYFHAVASLVEHDAGIWLASAWNDNGMRGQVRDMAQLRRTSYFPGLGWLLPRRLWEDELAAKWPSQHWDHFLRDATQHKWRDVVHPEVPRDYHFGIKGTFMDKNTHNKYFKPIAMAANPLFSWFSQAGEAAVAAMCTPTYDAALRGELQGARVLQSVQELESFTGQAGVVYVDSPIEPNTPFHPIASYFGIWHEPNRGARDGILQVPWGANGKVFIVNVHAQRPSQQKTKHAAPAGTAVLRGPDFAGRQRPASSLQGTAEQAPLKPEAASSPSQLRVYSPLAEAEAEAAFFAERYDDFGWEANAGLIKVVS